MYNIGNLHKVRQHLSKIEEKVQAEKYKKVMTVGTGVSKLAKKGADVLYGWPHIAMFRLQHRDHSKAN